MNEQEILPPVPRRDWALFLDFDGTLTELAPSPDAVLVDPSLPGILAALEQALGGALAVVSGRPLSEVDALMGVALPGAGVHGLELRERKGNTPHPPLDDGSVSTVQKVLAPLVADDPRLILEIKPGAIALHYRRAPEREEECRAAMLEALRAVPDFRLIDGKMVLEAKPGHVNKGEAIRRLMNVAPFAGRVPVFAGDDRTDEDGFEVVNAMKGVTIKIGAGESHARHRVPSVEEFLVWLGKAASLLTPAT